MVLGNWKNKGKYYPGVISLANQDLDLYSIHFDDGDIEHNIPSNRIKLYDNGAFKPLNKFNVGDRIEGNWKNKGNLFIIFLRNKKKYLFYEYIYIKLGIYYSGTISQVNIGNNYNINFDDGDMELYVPETRIKFLKKEVDNFSFTDSQYITPPKTTSSFYSSNNNNNNGFENKNLTSPASAICKDFIKYEIQIDDKIEYLNSTSKTYKIGFVKSIDYDKSTINLFDKILNKTVNDIDIKNIRLFNVFFIGQCIKGLWKNRTTWYAGRIASINEKTGLYEIFYDDGDM